MRKWFPTVMTACAFAVSIIVYLQLPDPVAVTLAPLVPFAVSGEAEPESRAAVAFLLPSIALVVAALLHEAPVRPLGRAAGRLAGFGGAGRTSEVEYHKFAPSYRLIVAWVVMLVLSVHAAVLSSALGWGYEPGRIVGIVFGAGLAIVGNVMPRLRPNPVAGVRTARTMADPRLWARVHRAYGAYFVIAGIVVLGIALAAPRYALVSAAAALALSTVVLVVPGVSRAPAK